MSSVSLDASRLLWGAWQQGQALGAERSNGLDLAGLDERGGIREPGMSASVAELQTLSGRTLPAAVRMSQELLRAQLRDNAEPATPAKKSQPPAPPRQR